MAENEGRDDRLIQCGLYAVAVSCVLAAIGHCVWPDRIDEKTAMFLGLAAAVLIIRDISKIEFPGWKIEKVRRELKQEVQKVHRKVSRLEDLWNTDPNKGQFGGSPQANGRVLEAIIKPAKGPRSAACDIEFSVRSTDPLRPLSGKVTIYLHPTAGNKQKIDVPVVDGVAQYKTTSWGVYTVGAVADDGKTKLELDLAGVKGGTKRFYEA